MFDVSSGVYSIYVEDKVVLLKFEECLRSKINHFWIVQRLKELRSSVESLGDRERYIKYLAEFDRLLAIPPAT